MFSLLTKTLTLVLIASVARGGALEELTEELAAATDPGAVHRLKARVANAAVARLETEPLSSAEKKKLIAQARAHCADVQLGAMDLWFGDSIVTWARLMMLAGDWKGARSALLDQAEVLENIEKNLAANNIPISSISPVAGGRYALGETYRVEYERTGELVPAVAALKHFYNVHVKYGDSPWGPPAREKAEAAQAFVESEGKRVRIDLGPHRAAYVAAMFKLGARLVAEEQHEEALEPLDTALNVFPESGPSIPAARNLGVCFARLGDQEAAFATAEYLAERFAADTNVPSAVLSIGRQYIDAGDDEPGERIFALYLAAFPDDLRRADILSFFAWKAYKAEDWPDAVARFHALETELRQRGETGAALEKAVFVQVTRPEEAAKLARFIAEFPDSELVPAAMSKRARALLVAGDFDGAFAALQELGERYPDAPEAKGSLVGLIDAAVEAGRFDVAERVLDRMLADKQAYGHAVYVSTGEGLLAAKRFRLAEKAFAAVPLNAKREHVERALFGLGAARYGDARFEDCVLTIDYLLAKHPTTSRFRAARLTQARALVELGRTEEAVGAYGEVLAARRDLAVALELAAILPDPEEKLAAYQRVALLADPAARENRPLIAESVLASLPLCAELGKRELLVRNCEQFAELFPEHDQLQTVARYRKEAERALVH